MMLRATRLTANAHYEPLYNVMSCLYSFWIERTTLIAQILMITKKGGTPKRRESTKIFKREDSIMSIILKS